MLVIVNIKLILVFSRELGVW